MNDQDKDKRSFLLNLTTEAKSYLIHGKKEEALKCYDKILEKYPDEKSVLYGKGMIYYEFNEFTKALECFDKILDKFPEDVDSLYAKGSILRFMNKKEEALILLNKAIKLDPHLIMAWLTKGYILLDLNKSKEALECFTKVEEFGKGSVALAGKGHSYLQLNNIKEASNCYEKVLKIDPYDPEALYGLGVIEYQKNNLKIAQDFLYKSVIQDESNLDAWIYLAEIFRKTKQTEREKIALDKIADLQG